MTKEVPKPSPAANSNQGATRYPRGTPTAIPGLVEFIERQRLRGNVERWELQVLSATSNPRVIEDYDAGEGKGSAEQFADLVWARAVGDSNESPELASVFYGLQSFVDPDTGSGALKRFTVPMPSRVDGRPLEQANPEGVLSASMRHLNKSAELSNVFAGETAKMLGDSFDRAHLSFQNIEKAYRAQVESLQESAKAQIEWRDKELERLRDRNEKLEARSLETFQLSEDLQSAKFDRDLAALKAAHGEERKNKVADHVIANVLPIVTRKFGGFLMGGGAPPAPVSPAPAGGDASAQPFSLAQQHAIKRFLQVLGAREVYAIEQALKDSPAGPAFVDLVNALFEEAREEAEAEAAAAHGVNGATNGAPAAAPGGTS